MLKENGRLKPKEHQEVANTTVKVYFCPKCKRPETLTDVEFGTIYTCSACGGVLEEKS